MLSRRSWLIIALLALVVFIAWPGRLLYINYLTQAEAARIAAITPADVASTIPERLNIERLMADVTWLADAEREGRLQGSNGGIAARNYIAQRFHELGLEPAGTEGYFHPFTTSVTDNAANVVGIVPGTRPNLRTLVLTAHYDHLGVRDGDIYHGADDNASGVAAILEIARFLQQYPNQHPIMIIALDSEERGIQGSRALFSTGFLAPETIAFNLNLDMLSRDTEQLLYAVGTYHRPWLTPLVRRVQLESGAKLLMAHDRPRRKAGNTPDWTTASDHVAFHEQNIPFLYLGVADHNDYHRPTDTADRVDIEFFRATSETALSFVLLIDQVLAEKARD
ncbi:M28 family peptidase [Aliidiomarina celeris]|uniref:M28 family peptidase n=1 Tax=Aliidiomarina celeris TaxID=2249428 RepID=UPI000DEA2EAE|nr:M28 family peptidase [Aliidiomarina celeris]